jgi:hypothetical protein
MSIGEYAEASVELRSLVADRVRVLGELSPATMVSHRMYAACLVELGRVAEAVPHLRAVEQATSRVLGADARDAVSARWELASALDLAGATAEADELFATIPGGRDAFERRADGD